MIAREDLPLGLRHLLDRLRAFRVKWDPTGDDYVLGRDREEFADLDRADVTSSAIKRPWGDQRHVIALDIDYPVYVVPSSTPGHHHLYIDVPNGIEHNGYMALVSLLGHLGVIEQGYAQVSIQRGHTDLRLPWVRKGDEPGRKASSEEAPTPSAALLPF